MPRLIILGNGFDRNYQLPTDYTNDLRPILQEKNSEMFSKLDKLYFGEEIKYWSDFEGNIGQVKSLEFIHDRNRKNLENLYNVDYYPYDSGSELYGDDYTAIDNAINEAEMNAVDLEEVFNDEHAEDLENLYGYIEEGFKEMSLNSNQYLLDNIGSIVDEFEFSSNDYFITFNYTSSLEILNPDICPENIFHIHGKAEKDDELIFGNIETKIENRGSDLFEMNPYYGPSNKGGRDISNYDDFIDAVYVPEESFSVYNVKVDEAIDTLNNQMIKPLQKEELISFLRNKEITHIYVYGLSCGEVDIEYLEKINEACSSPHWCFSFYRNKASDPVCINSMKLSFFHFIDFKESTSFKKYLRKI